MGIAGGGSRVSGLAAEDLSLVLRLNDRAKWEAGEALFVTLPLLLEPLGCVENMLFKVSWMEESTTAPGFLLGEDLLIGEPVTSIDEAEVPLRIVLFTLFSNDLVGIEDNRSNTLDLLAVDEVAIALLL